MCWYNPSFLHCEELRLKSLQRTRLTMPPTIGAEALQASCWLCWREREANVLNLLKCSIINSTKLMVTLCRKGRLSVVVLLVLITTGTILHPSWGRPSLEYTYPAAPASQLKVSTEQCWLFVDDLLNAVFSFQCVRRLPACLVSSSRSSLYWSSSPPCPSLSSS